MLHAYFTLKQGIFKTGRCMEDFKLSEVFTSHWSNEYARQEFLWKN